MIPCIEKEIAIELSVTDIYSKEVEEQNFRKVNNSVIEGMIHVNGKQISIMGNEISAFTSVAEDKIKEALVIRANQEVVRFLNNFHLESMGSSGWFHRI